MVSTLQRPATPPHVGTESTPATAREIDRARIRLLLEQYSATPTTALRDELVTLHLGVVRYVTAKFASRSECFDDLYQVGCIGLVKALNRFDATRGLQFLTFAIPTITGEIRKYFRDLRYSVRVPRLIQSRWPAFDAATASLTRTHGRSPTYGEVAALMGVSEEVVIEAQEARQSRTTFSMDGLDSSGREGQVMPGKSDPGIADVEDQMAASALVKCLTPAERHLVDLRFTQQMSQRSIGQGLGVSQMQVSRLLARVVAKMRRACLADPGTRSAPINDNSSANR